MNAPTGINVLSFGFMGIGFLILFHSGRSSCHALPIFPGELYSFTAIMRSTSWSWSRLHLTSSFVCSAWLVRNAAFYSFGQAPKDSRGSGSRRRQLQQMASLPLPYLHETVDVVFFSNWSILCVCNCGSFHFHCLWLMYFWFGVVAEVLHCCLCYCCGWNWLPSKQACCFLFFCIFATVMSTAWVWVTPLFFCVWVVPFCNPPFLCIK